MKVETETDWLKINDSILEYGRRIVFSIAKQTKNTYDILCLTETWLTEKVAKGSIFLEKFETRRQHINGRTKHGSVMIGISNKKIPHCCISSNFDKCLIIKFQLKNLILIACIYCTLKGSKYWWSTKIFKKTCLSLKKAIKNWMLEMCSLQETKLLLMLTGRRWWPLMRRAWFSLCFSGTDVWTNNNGKRKFSNLYDIIKSIRNCNIREGGQPTEVCIHHQLSSLPHETKFQLPNRTCPRNSKNNNINFSAFSFSKKKTGMP